MRTLDRAVGSIHFVTTDFNPLRTNVDSNVECRRYDSYLCFSLHMGRTYGSHDYFMHLSAGLKSGVTRFAEATPL